MKKISDSLIEVIQENSFLRFGMQSRLLNLTQVARYLRPIIAARLSREVRESAVLMSLSRLQQRYPYSKSEISEEFLLESLVIQTNLCVLSYQKKNKVRQEINKFYNRIQKEEAYITLTEGISEVSIIFESEQYGHARKIISEKPSLKYMDIAALGVRFKVSDIGLKGLYFSIFQDIFLQGISLVEIASAASELILFMEESNLKLAFDTLYQRLKRK